MARPRKNIDPKMIEDLAAIMCSYAEMAEIVGCNESTLTRRFALAIKKGRSRGASSLRKRQFQMALGSPAEYIKDSSGQPVKMRDEIKPSIAMLIWLGKQYLGQSEKMQFPDDNDRGFDV